MSSQEHKADYKIKHKNRFYHLSSNKFEEC